MWLGLKAIDSVAEWTDAQARKVRGMMARMATPVLIALIVSASAVAAVLASTYLVMHYSPYQTCVRQLLEEDANNHAGAALECAHYLNGN